MDLKTQQFSRSVRRFETAVVILAVPNVDLIRDLGSVSSAVANFPLLVDSLSASVGYYAELSASLVEKRDMNVSVLISKTSVSFPEGWDCFLCFSFLCQNLFATYHFLHIIPIGLLTSPSSRFAEEIFRICWFFGRSSFEHAHTSS